MRKRLALFASFALLLVWAIRAQRGQVDAVEIGRHNTDLLPSGKEADGITGDFILRNDKIHALISGAQPLRRANMSTEYAHVTQGVLYDLDLRGAGNDQITAFRPGALGGEVSWVRVVEEGARGVVEVVRTAEKGSGLYERHKYRLEPGWQHVLITSTFRNASREPKKIRTLPVWKGLAEVTEVDGVTTGDSFDPQDRRGYAYAQVGGAPLVEEAELGPGEERTCSVALVVAESPLVAYGVLKALQGATGEVSGQVTDVDGKPVASGELNVEIGAEWLPAYPGPDGRVAFRLPPGQYRAMFADIGRDNVQRQISVEAGQAASADMRATRAPLVRVEIRDEQGRPSPGRVQFLGIDGTPTPNFGPDIRANGGNHQHQTHDGRVVQQVPAGKYLLRVTRGPEFDLVEKTIEVGKGQAVEVAATLRRVVDTTGWVATDYHAHSTPSGDNYCNTRDRIINFAAEHLEFIPTTEHNRIFDWQPVIDRLGLAGQLKTVLGIELTGSGQHFNAFPLARDPLAQDGGAPMWNYDPRINAIVLRNWGTPTLDPRGSRYDAGANAQAKIPYFGGGPDRWVQANHPVVGRVFFDRDDDGVEDGGFVGFENLIDAAEFWSTEILNLSPWFEGWAVDGERPRERYQNRTFGWLQLLNQGRRVWCVAVSDAHNVFGNGVGGWRTYVPSSTDEPAKLDPAELIRNSKSGRMMITNGPFLKMTTGDGLPIGSSVAAEGHVDLKIEVQAPAWMEVNRVQVLVDGRQPREYNFTKKTHAAMFREGVVRFRQTVRVKLARDAHLIVVAIGEGENLKKYWGLNPYGNMHPIAYTNPIFVDVDRNGWQANGDTLDHPLVTAPKWEE